MRVKITQVKSIIGSQKNQKETIKALGLGEIAFGIVKLILGAIPFGIGKSFSFITGVIAISPFVVILWSSFGEQLMGMFKFKKNKQ